MAIDAQDIIEIGRDLICFRQLSDLRRDTDGLSGGSIFDRADDRRENGSAGPACDRLGNDATNAQIARLCRSHDRRQRQSCDLAEHPATNQARDNVADRTQIEIWRCFAEARATECSGNKVDQNLFHDRSPGWVDRA
jgi:hypothetical protein